MAKNDFFIIEGTDSAMQRTWTTSRWSILALGMVAAMLGGCNSLRIDKTGEHLFAPPPGTSYAPAVETIIPAGSAALANAGGTVLPTAPPLNYNPNDYYPWDDVSLILTPAETIAPVGSKVILVAGVGTADGYLHTNSRLEWSILPGSVGQFTEIGQSDIVDWFRGDYNRHAVIGGNYAIGSTSRHFLNVSRGTGNPNDVVYVSRGQGWIAISSGAEGTSTVNVYAPEVDVPQNRVKTARVHWVDAAWRFPPPGIKPAGARHFLTTTVVKSTNQLPCAGWTVRYQIVSGPSAGFAADGAQSIDVPTDAQGQANAEIFQKTASPGVNAITIQVIRPATLPGTSGQALTMGTGSTTMTWGSGIATGSDLGTPGLSGSTPTFSGNTTPGLGGAGGVAAATPGGTGGSPSTFGPSGTTSGVPSGVNIQVTGPTGSVAVGDNARFDITITNRGTTPLTQLVAKDHYEDGLIHPKKSPIETQAPFNIPAGGTHRLDLVFRVGRAGTLCHTVEVFDASRGISLGSQKSCVTAVDRGLGGGQPSGLGGGTAGVSGTGGMGGTGGAGGSAFGQQRSAAPGGMGTGQGAAGQGSSPGSPTGSGQAGGTAGMPAAQVKLNSIATQKVGNTFEFLMTVYNRGQTPLNNALVQLFYDSAVQALEISSVHTKINGGLQWTIPSIAAGGGIQYKAICKCQRPSVKASCRVVVTASSGVKLDEKEVFFEIQQAGSIGQGRGTVGQGAMEQGTKAQEKSAFGAGGQGITGQGATGQGATGQGTAGQGMNRQTTPLGSSQLQVDVSPMTNPVKAGNYLTYVIRIINYSAKADQQVILKTTLPDGMVPMPLGTLGPDAFVGPTIEGQTVTFTPKMSIQPGETLTYKVRAKAKMTGKMQFKAEVSSTNLTQPLVQTAEVEVN